MKKAIITACTFAAALVAGSALAGGATGEHPYRNGVMDNSPAFYSHMQDRTNSDNLGLTQPTATGTDSSSGTTSQ
ncbi:hypothetical protein [Silvimonas iriomotensis]|uniref:Uncharacterized protein n=1 Tax=Silvimonas iriomotensis TaxID=449662 RepID=A0ABQ2P5Y6_9NEIS|nr:hypothetical protein [Silvimonas iriomotensis]GGP19022.1 hypothetical protein GCM10010970_08550 [Silvimonas iriomotensis]